MAYYQTPAPKRGFNYCYDDMDCVLNSVPVGQHIVKSGRVVNRIYTAKDSSYGIYEIEDSDNRRFVVTGQFPVQPTIDGFYEFTGTVKPGKRGDHQLAVEKFRSVLPETSTGIITLLTTLPGLDTRAHTLYQVFGQDVLKVIKTDPARVANAIKGVSLGRAKLWQQHLLRQEREESGMVALLAFGLNTRQAGVLMDKYGAAVIDKIQTDPYFLMGELPRFPFPKCDAIALRNGAHPEDTTRLIQVMLYTLRHEAAQKGHCYLPLPEFMDRAARIANVNLDYRQATALLKQGHQGEVTLRIGDNLARIDLAELALAVQAWESGRRGPFTFPAFHIPAKLLREAIDLSGNAIRIQEVDGEQRVYAASLLSAERLIASSVQTIGQFIGPTEFDGLADAIQSVCQGEKVTLEERQLQAVETICARPGGIYILSGSAGCGKTFTLNIIIKALQKLVKAAYNRPLQASILAPTGKAAKVASLSTGLNASTIHVALGLGQDGHFSKTVTGDVVVIDEMSMVDTYLASELFAATSPTTKVILLGDVKQLPSIGPGLVLRDLIDSGAVPVTELTVVKRQGQGGILTNANNIIQGQPIQTITCGRPDLDGDAYVVEETDPTRCQELVLRSVDGLLLRHTLDDVQVLSPQHKGETGVDTLNLCLQRRLNPNAAHPPANAILNRKVESGAGEAPLYFLPGDKVIHIHNNYQAQWYSAVGGRLLPDLGHVGITNGEVGVIHSVGVEGGHRIIIVRYADGYIKYEDDFSELDHAYALTIHKAQGSQWAAVVCPILGAAGALLNRNLLYTMCTRARNTSVVIGNRRILDRAVANDEVQRRNTGLRELLEQQKQRGVDNR